MKPDLQQMSTRLCSLCCVFYLDNPNVDLSPVRRHERYMHTNDAVVIAFFAAKKMYEAARRELIKLQQLSS